jgi:hypothetical protein
MTRSPRHTRYIDYAENSTSLEKINVTEVFHADTYYSLDGSLPSAIQHFQDMLERGVNKGYENININTVTKYGRYDDNWQELEFYGTRLETEKEFNNRMKRVETDKQAKAKRKDLQEQEELSLYKKLHKKFKNYKKEDLDK